MRSCRALAVSTLAATAIAGAIASGTVSATADDDDGDKNVLLAEAQWQLLLLTANFVPTDITCTRPPVRDDTGELLCYALISERVSVAAVATMAAPGVYSFLPLNKVDPADLFDEAPASGEPSSPGTPDTPNAPDAPDEPDQHNATDQAILASIDAAVADAQGIAGVLTENNPSIVSVDLIDYHAPTSTVQVSLRTDLTDPSLRDSVAFFVTDIMAFLWMKSEPIRAADANIRPRLEVDVDGVLYGTPFEVMTEVADYTITEREWLEIVTGGGAFQPAFKFHSSKDVAKAGGKLSGYTLSAVAAVA
jgi:hypothetical protein